MERYYVQQFNKGALEMILLCLIAQKETYGYEILTRLNQQGGQVLGYAREGTIYPILYRLQDKGLVRCRMAPSPANGGMKKYYSLTEEGQALLGELTGFWEDYVRCVEGFLKPLKEGLQ